MFAKALAAVARSGVRAVAAPSSHSVAPAAVRCFSMVTVPFDGNDPDFVVFPREKEGTNYDLNWSLADDRVTPRGDAFRNADERTLHMYASAKPAKGSLKSALTVAKPGTLFATDEFEGFEVADIDEFEERADTLRLSFSYAPRLFVHDGAVGANREAAIRVRVITDSADYALFARTMLNTVPLGNPQTIPRPLTVYIATGNPGPAYTASDFDPDTGCGMVAASGNAAISDLRRQVEHVASLMTGHGGYQSVRGGAGYASGALQRARSEGSLDMREHFVATEGADQLLHLGGSVFVSDSGASTVVLGGGDAATAGAYAAHACVWGPSGVASFWAGSVGSAGGAGSVTLGSETASPAAATGTVAHPARIVVVGGSSDKASKADAAAVATAARLNEADAETLAARLTETGTEVVTVSAAGVAKSLAK